MNIKYEIEKLSPKDHDIIVIKVPKDICDRDMTIIKNEIGKDLNKLNCNGFICYEDTELKLLSDEQLENLGLKRIK